MQTSNFNFQFMLARKFIRLQFCFLINGTNYLLPQQNNTLDPNAINNQIDSFLLTLHDKDEQDDLCRQFLQYAHKPLPLAA
jgi:hypothetical protein